jgi:hypothetical protein
MRHYVVAVFGIFSLATACIAQDATNADNAANPTTSILIARTGESFQSPHVGTYHLVEFFQLRGKWIYPDVGYIDFGTNNYHEVFVGGGRTFYDGKKGMVIEEFYYDQAFGPASKSARYFQPWTFVQVNLSPKFAGEAVYFPYLPLNQSARIQHVLERVKVERKIGKNWRIGAGYAGYKYGDEKWQNKPFVTVTRGPVEIWPFQKIPGGAQAQLRLTFSHTAKK